MSEEFNKQIADFMGAEYDGGSTIATDGSFTDLYKVCINPNGRFKDYYEYYDKPTAMGIHSISGLQYHSSWDWLMPVVEKIYTLEAFRHTAVYYKVIHAFIINTIEQVYSLVVEFIQYYNQNKKIKIEE